jgi:hypothetical protein
MGTDHEIDEVEQASRFLHRRRGRRLLLGHDETQRKQATLAASTERFHDVTGRFSCYYHLAALVTLCSCVERDEIFPVYEAVCG